MPDENSSPRQEAAPCVSSALEVVLEQTYPTATREVDLRNKLGVSENRQNPIVPNGFADHYPYEKWLFH